MQFEIQHVSGGLLGQTQVLLGHLAADRVVEIPVLLECLESQLVVDLVEAPEEGPHKLHPADLAQQLSNTSIRACILGPHGNVVVSRLELHVLGSCKAISLAHCLLMGSVLCGT